MEVDTIIAVAIAEETIQVATRTLVDATEEIQIGGLRHKRTFERLPQVN